MSFTINYYLGYTITSRQAPSCSSTGQITSGCGGKLGLDVQHPAEIVNYQSTGATPVILAAGLAVGAIVALALTLIAYVRRQRRDLALLKTLGFTSRQLAATVASQASAIAAIAAVVGVPVGIAAGRQLWILFARNINAVPQPTVPASLLLVAAGALILANLVAAVPARMAWRTPAALVRTYFPESMLSPTYLGVHAGGPDSSGYTRCFGTGTPRSSKTRR
jgi:asparagine N-glycosylation enzyme membrane subunit Stt3